MNSTIEKITPLRAMEYLKTSEGNRNLSKQVINSYALTMKKGKWMLNGESIVFDEEGHLINGHHRLEACKLAGVPFKTYVIRGIDKNAFVTFDCGRQRTMSQLIGMQGIKHYNTVASVVNFSQALVKGYTIGETTSLKKGHGHTTNLSRMDVFNEDREGYIKAANLARSITDGCRLLDNSMVGGCIYFLSRYCGYKIDTAETFFREIISFSTCDDMMLEILRVRLVKEKCSNTSCTPRAVLLALLIKTWNYYMTGKVVKCLKYTAETEEYPKFLSAADIAGQRTSNE